MKVKIAYLYFCIGDVKHKISLKLLKFSTYALNYCVQRDFYAIDEDDLLIQGHKFKKKLLQSPCANRSQNAHRLGTCMDGPAGKLIWMVMGK